MATYQSTKVWFITGCSSGFGEALTREALSRGDKVIATARNLASIQSLQEIGANVMQLDVTSPLEQLQAKAKEAHAIYNHVDYLVNNAGYGITGALEEISPLETQQQFDTNVFGALNVTRAFLPFFRAQRSGVIANISSNSAWIGAPGWGMYSISKAAMSMMSEVMTAEFAELGVSVCSIEPGGFRSKILGSDNLKKPANHIEAYDGTTVRKVMEYLKMLNGTQAGDMQKGVKVIVDVLTGKMGEKIPPRLTLGSDAFPRVKQKCEDVIKLLAEQEEFASATNVDEGTQRA